MHADPTQRMIDGTANDLPAPLPSVTVVVLSWNGREDTLACVESVLALDYPRFRTLVVDNASTDGTVDALRQRFGSRVDVLRNGANLLYAGGMNVGIEQARRTGTDYVLLLNNDIVLDPGMLRALVASAAPDERIAAAGPKIYYSAEPQRLWFAGGEMSLWRGWPRHTGLREMDRGQHDQPRDVDYLTGCAVLVRAKSFDDVGLLDAGFRMYAEDADWCLRARAKGYRLRYAPDARMWHKVSASAGARSWFKIRRRFRSQIRLLARHARWYHWLVIPAATVIEGLRITWGLSTRRS
ncbi:MAG TPA: glycosyltransferase family 2 protein [Candidatus Krumholzibacteria bacterium]|nr:glycosyltransferase family 2 protein [Candidatus Krumholzibacteria bacterium]